MKRSSSLGLMFVASAMVGLPTQPTQAEDFFSALFRTFGVHRPAPPTEAGPFDYAPEQPQYSPRRLVAFGTAYCVRTCDGRYFPAPPAANQSRAETCQSFCPAAETKVFYGHGIDDAASEAGKPYSELPNAFKYRTELVAGCSCNGSDPVGLAKIKVEDDRTLRRGDLVVDANGVKVATGRSDSAGPSAELVPAPPPRSVRSRLERRPSVAAN
jgi:hypothetical protein